MAFRQGRTRAFRGSCGIPHPGRHVGHGQGALHHQFQHRPDLPGRALLPQRRQRHQDRHVGRGVGQLARRESWGGPVTPLLALIEFAAQLAAVASRVVAGGLAGGHDPRGDRRVEHRHVGGESQPREEQQVEGGEVVADDLLTGEGREQGCDCPHRVGQREHVGQKDVPADRHLEQLHPIACRVQAGGFGIQSDRARPGRDGVRCRSRLGHSPHRSIPH